MTNSNGRKIPNLRKIFRRGTTRIFETYTPRKLPDGAVEPKNLQFKGHQRPGEASSNQSEPSSSASTPEQFGEAEVSELQTTPAEQSQS